MVAVERVKERGGGGGGELKDQQLWSCKGDPGREAGKGGGGGQVGPQ